MVALAACDASVLLQLLHVAAAPPPTAAAAAATPGQADSLAN